VNGIHDNKNRIHEQRQSKALKHFSFTIDAQHSKRLPRNKKRNPFHEQAIYFLRSSFEFYNHLLAEIHHSFLMESTLLDYQNKTRYGQARQLTVQKPNE
jgi:hypothetical protein